MHVRPSGGGAGGNMHITIKGNYSGERKPAIAPAALGGGGGSRVEAERRWEVTDLGGVITTGPSGQPMGLGGSSLPRSWFPAGR